MKPPITTNETKSATTDSASRGEASLAKNETAGGVATAETSEVDIEISVTELDAEPSWPSAKVAAARRGIVGKTLSERYRVDRLLAEGGMGSVYLGEHIHMRKRVAIKVLRPETEGFPELVMRFEREAIAGAHVDHPNVAAASDFGRLGDGSYFLVLEYVEGVTLRDHMKRGPVSVIEAARIGRQLAEALGACHRMNLLHRDVKPRNVMIEAATGRVKLIDFGLARVPDRITRPEADEEGETRKSITLKGVVFGTVAYLAPEAEFGMDGLDGRADLYAVGVVLYELFTGKHPFNPTDPSPLFLCHKVATPPPFRVRAPERLVPSAFEAVTMRLLAKKPEERYADAEALVAALDDAIAEAGRGIASESTFEPVTSGRASASSERATAAGATRPQSLATPSAVNASDLLGTVRRPKRAPFLVIAALAAFALGGAAALPLRDRPPRATLAKMGSSFAVADEFGEAAVRALREDHGARVAHAKARLHEAADARRWSPGADAILKLADEEAGAALDARDVGAAATIALGLAFAESPRTDAVFDALANRLGEQGVDVLYDITSKHGGARAARLADEMLAKPAVRARGTAELRAVLALRDAACEEKASHFDAAAEEGDERALLLLERLRGTNCAASRCCYIKNRPLDDSIARLKTRNRAPRSD